MTEDAIGYFEWVTGRYFSDYPLAPTPETETMSAFTFAPLADSPELIQTCNRVVRMLVEQEGMQAQRTYVDTVTDDGIASFSAGSYSESRVPPSEAHHSFSRAAQQPTVPTFNSWPNLNRLLTQLMTPERYAYWLAMNGGIPPAWNTTEVDWSLVGKDTIYAPYWSDPMTPQPWLGIGFVE
jgi:hypothetical protein